MYTVYIYIYIYLYQMTYIYMGYSEKQINTLAEILGTWGCIPVSQW